MIQLIMVLGISQLFLSDYKDVYGYNVIFGLVKHAINAGQQCHYGYEVQIFQVYNRMYVFKCYKALYCNYDYVNY